VFGAGADRWGRVQRRRAGIAFGVYLLLCLAFFAMMPRSRLSSHSPHNHYSLQAAAWLDGRLDLGGPPPAYTGNNDFAQYDGKYWVSFPPVPAVIMLPLVAAAGSPERVRDAAVFAWLAPIGPVLLFLLFERLRRLERSQRSQRHNAWLALLFGLGTVYWFSAVQGSVWFGGHVVSVGLLCGYLLCSVDARHPALAGLLLALAFGTRPTMALALPFFALELWQSKHEEPAQLLRRALAFVLPAAAVVALLMWHNDVRFGDPTEFGHRMLAIAWRKRIDEWGLFSFRYLRRNLGVVLGSLPQYSAEHGLRISGHGLALWLTSPFFLWALWPKRAGVTYWAAALSLLAMAATVLLYQNTGWVQFGYRFSNDFAPLLFVMLVVGGRRLSLPFWLLAAFSIGLNGFGALTFGKRDYARHYFIHRSQNVLPHR
jgi:hypothetical protein